MNSNEFDVFISHAYEDKDAFVRPLVERLVAYGIKPWYDEFTLHVGDSLSRSIDKGLTSTRFGIVVLSHAFFSKKWPEYELRGLTTKEIDGESKILPVWYGISKIDVSRYSPSLADTIALNSQTDELDDIAREIVRVVRPDIMRTYDRVRLAQKMLGDSSKDFSHIMPEINKTLPPTNKRSKLTDDFRLRVRLIRSAFIDVFNDISFTGWCDTFAGNENPEEDLIFWENMAAAYLEYCAVRKPSPEKKYAVFKCFFCTAMRYEQELFSDSLKQLPPNDINIIEELLGTGKLAVQICDTWDELNALIDE